jgi:hypothetical protein
MSTTITSANKVLQVSQFNEEMRKRAERARRIGLFRYEVVQDAVDAALSAEQRGARWSASSLRGWLADDEQSVDVADLLFACSVSLAVSVTHSGEFDAVRCRFGPGWA